MIETIKPSGRFYLEHWRGNKLLSKNLIDNLVTTQGKNAMLNIMFGGGTQILTWYAGLISNAGFTTVAVTDTHASHAGWVEFVAYDEANRVEWAEDAAAAGSMTNTTLMVFTINAIGSVRGLFLSNENVKGDTSAETLWCATELASAQTVIVADVLRLTYTPTLT